MKVVSLFSGAGGFDLGFIRAGHEIVYAVDNDKQACETYRKNIGPIVCKDIREVSSDEIPDCDVVIGGFPCQGFSQANGNRCVSDERNTLYLEMLRIIKDKQPEWFVAENVRGILSLGKGEVIKQIVDDFKSVGYNVEYQLLNCADYGVPQMRQRVFIIGNNSGKEIKFPQPTHYDPTKEKIEGLKPYVTVRDTIGWLEDIPCSDEPIEIDEEIIPHEIRCQMLKVQ